MVHDELDILLKNRAVPEMRSNLTDRITRSALNVAQTNAVEKPSQKKRSLWGAVFENILIPQPVAVMAVVLVLGFYLGGSDLIITQDVVASTSDVGNVFFYSNLEIGDSFL